MTDSHVPHRSGPNRTSRPRRVLHVGNSRLSEGDHLTRDHADKRRSSPPDVEREPGNTHVYRV